MKKDSRRSVFRAEPTDSVVSLSPSTSNQDSSSDLGSLASILEVRRSTRVRFPTQRFVSTKSLSTSHESFLYAISSIFFEPDTFAETASQPCRQLYAERARSTRMVCYLGLSLSSSREIHSWLQARKRMR